VYMARPWPETQRRSAHRPNTAAGAYERAAIYPAKSAGLGAAALVKPTRVTYLPPTKWAQSDPPLWTVYIQTQMGIVREISSFNSIGLGCQQTSR
jgi:hypothetical protein